MTEAVRRAILVAGSHRSGTSALAGTLSLLGVDLGSDLLPPNAGNERGYWEHAGIVEVHDRLLASLSSLWDQWLPLPEGWQQSAAARRAHRALVEILRRDFDDSALFGVKDPRLCRLLPLWAGVLREIDRRPLIVMVNRHPVEVAGSLERRDGLAAERGFLLWLDHLLAAESGSRGSPRLLVSYAELLADWRRVVEKIQVAGSIRWPLSPEQAGTGIDDFLAPSLRHHQVADDDLSEGDERKIPGMVARAYRAVLRFSDIDDPRLRAALSPIRQQLAEAAELLSSEALAASAPLHRHCRILEQRSQELQAGLGTARQEFDQGLAAFRRARTNFWLDLAAEKSAGANLELELTSLTRKHQALREQLEHALEDRAQLGRELESERRALRPPRAEADRENAEPTSEPAALATVKGASPLHCVEFFQAHWIGEETRPTLAVSGWCFVPGDRQPVRLELRSDGATLAAADCTLERCEIAADHPHHHETSSLPRCGFRLELPLPHTGDRFDLVHAATGTVLASRLHWLLWPPRKRETYAAFRHNHLIRPHLEGLLTQALAGFDRRPRFSILLPATADSAGRLADTLASLRCQIYPEWQVSIAVEPSAASRLEEAIDLADPRLERVLPAEGTALHQLANAAAETATGEYFGLLHPGDRLAPEALFEAVCRLQSDSSPDVFYSDHDFVDGDGRRSQPRFKPDWSPTFLLGHDYIGRAVFVRRTLFSALGGLRPRFARAEIYDLLLRAAETTGDVVHIPRVLFHLRRGAGDPAEADTGARAARRRALQRRGLPAWLPAADDAGTGPVESLEWPDEGPSVTVVVPTFNQCRLLRRCVESILRKTTYRNFDILIVDNDSDDPDTLEYLREVADGLRVRTLQVPKIDGEFSFSRVNNAAVRLATADYLLLLNNDTEVSEPRWLSRLMGYGSLAGVGAVGARLLYPDGSLQHAGVALGMNRGPLPGHLFYGRSTAEAEAEHLHLASACREVSAVTGACLLTARRLFLELEGLDEGELPVAFNDVDYCLRLAGRGLSTVYVAHAELTHFESRSRSPSDDPAQLTAFKRRHGATRERYTSPTLTRRLGDPLRLDPRCALRHDRFLTRPLRVLWAFPDAVGGGAEPPAATLAAAAAGPWIESILLVSEGCAQRSDLAGGDLQSVEAPGFDQLRRLWDDHRALTVQIRELRIFLERLRPDVLVAGSFESFPFIHAAAAAAIPSVWRLPEHVSPGDLDHSMPEPARSLLDPSFAMAQRVAFGTRHTLELWQYLDTRLTFEWLGDTWQPTLSHARPSGATPQPRPPGATTTPAAAPQARELPGLTAGDKVLLCPVGTGPMRCWQTFLEAIRALAEKRGDFRILLSAEPGAGDTLDQLQDAVRELGLEHLLVTGESNRRADRHDPAADALVIGSSRGLRPAVLMQAMAESLPLVSGEPWALGEQIQGVNALICEPKDPQGLASALDRLLSSSSLRRRLGADSRSLLGTFPSSAEVGHAMARLVAAAWQTGPQNGPRFGLLIDFEGPPPLGPPFPPSNRAALQLTVESLRRQTYAAWELCLVVRSDGHLCDFLDDAACYEHRLSVHRVDPRLGLAARLNDAWQSLSRDWIGVLAPGDTLAPFALDEIAGFVESRPECDLVYCDEEQTLADGGIAFRLKPEWSPEMLIGEHYTGRPWLARTDLLERLEGFRDGYGAAAEWDLMLRAGEAGTRARRVPRPCGRRRQQSAENAEEVTDRGRAAVRDHLRRLGLDAEVTASKPGLLRAVWPVAGEPLVSIIIPNRDRPALMQVCLGGLLRRTDYRHREILIVDNGSTDPDVLKLYDSLTEQGLAKVLQFDQTFNYSAACNLGARHARGELLLFLNNDVEMLHQDWLEEMVRWACVPGVGIVGCKLLYRDGRIQHAAVTLGLNGLSGHLFYGLPEGDTAGPFGSADQYRNATATTGACQLVRRAVFDQLSGFDEGYAVIYSDIDLCVRAWQAGHRVVYTPFARLIHYEGSSRGKIEPRADERRFARLLRSIGVDADRFFHPGLRGETAQPQVRGADQPGAAHILQWWLKQHLADEAGEPLLDIRDRGQMQRFLAEKALDLAAPEQSHDDLESPDSGARPGDPIRRLYASRIDLQRHFPLALTPVDQRAFLPWLIESGKTHFDFDDATIWRFCQETWETGADGLLDCYLMHPDWQMLLPDAPTVSGWPAFVDWLAEQYPSASDWLRSLPRPPVLRSQLKPDAGEEGINVVANFCYPSGVQQAALASVAALELAGLSTSCRDLPTQENPLRAADVDRWRGFLGLELFDTTLLHVQPDLLPDVYEMAGLAPRSDIFRIGVWYWELESPPPESWTLAGSLLDELWAPTRFIAEALRKVMPIDVVTMPPGVAPPTFHPRPRRHFGLDSDTFLFFFSYDTLSITERKNPLGLIRAFRRAFDPGEKVRLVIKMLRGKAKPEDREQVLKAAQEAGVTVIEPLMSRSDSLALIDACDCYVSLHRSEGFGLPLAEAMLLGKPVIATAYSGNMDFMTPDNSLLVDFERVELAREMPPYPRDGTWAQPSEDHAAELMRRVYENRDEARSLGERARQDLEENLSLRAAGERMARRLRELAGDHDENSHRPSAKTMP